MASNVNESLCAHILLSLVVVIVSVVGVPEVSPEPPTVAVVPSICVTVSS